jgi:hypothetical protein
MGLKPRAIEVRIEELILHGVSPADALRVGAATEHELSRLLAEHGLPDSLAGGADLDAGDAGAFTRRSPATPGSIGGEIARAVYGGLDR